MERISYQDIPEGTFPKLMALEDFINNSGLSMKLLELVRVRVSQLNGCAYCVDMHYKLARHFGEEELRLVSLVAWTEAVCFTKEERAILQYTDALTKLGGNEIPQEVFDDLSLYYTKGEIAYLSLAISQINVWTRLMKAFKFKPGVFKVEE
ncbi:carboxymuconolactone decarboxylase family protein [Flagellimonas allohymeniacidonis]|nr:carboxymuconolactone decarboxylase family protein [Allomuricauda hymeniacidonis]